MELSKNEPDWRFESKWSTEIAEYGFTAIPNALLLYYDLFDLKPTEFLLLVNLESYRWESERLPYPSVDTLAKRLGVKSRTISRTMTSLETDKRLIRRIKRHGTSNEYDLYPLIQRLQDTVRYDKDGLISGHKLSKAHVIYGH